MQVTPEECATQVLEIVPLVMRTIHSQMRRHRAPELSVPQFRALAFLSRHEGASLSDVAGHLGLTLPSMSRLIDGLVARELVARQTSPSDRRCVTLTLTGRGRSLLEAARQGAVAYLTEKIATLTPADQMVILQAMQALRQAFPGEKEAAAPRP